MSPLDDLPELGSSNEEVAEPLGLANPLLPPEPLGQNLLYPQFLVPVATEPLMATNPSMFFPGGIPGYQPPENPFQASPFFAEARASLRTGQALGLPEVPQGSPRIPRPILSDLLGDLEFQTDFAVPAASPEPTTNEIEIVEVPTLEEGFEITEEQEIQPFPPEEIVEVELPTSPEVETKELIEPPPELSPSSPESSSNPLSVQAASEENYVADTSLTEPIAAALSPQETELVEPTVAFSSVSEELGSPVVPQLEEAPEETEPVVVPEFPELPEQPGEAEVTVSPEAELSEETEIPEPITANSPSPELAKILTEPMAENIAPETEPLSITPTAASSVITDLEQTAPEPEEVSESPESELPEEASLAAEAESAAEEIESIPELTNEAPVLSTEEITAEEEVAAQIVGPPISNPEEVAAQIVGSPISNPEEVAVQIVGSPISNPEEVAVQIVGSPISNPEEVAAQIVGPPISNPEEVAAQIVGPPISNPEEAAAQIVGPIGEELVGSVAEPTPFLAEAELTSPAETETPPSRAVSAEIESVEELENTERLPSSEENIAVPAEVIPEAEQNPENPLERESSPPISRIQELVEQQIEAFSGLEQEASTAPESAVPLVIEEGAQPAVEENIPLETPPEVPTTGISTPSLEIPIVTESESTPLQSNVELPVAQTEANVEAALSLPTILENLGILTPLITSSPLSQLANFLPVAESFASQRREGIPLGLEQPMTFASPPIPAAPLTQLANFLPVAEPFSSEQREGIPLGLEQPMTFASIIPPPLESSSSTTPNFPGTNEKLDLPSISDASSSTADSSTETESSISQEENLSFSAAMNSLPVVSTLPVMRNEGIFIPLTFAQRFIDNTQINDQEKGSPHSLSTQNIPQEWSSIEEFINSNPSIERDGFNSLFSPEALRIGNDPESGGYTPEISNFISSRSLENGEEQNFSSGSKSLDDMDEEILNLREDEDSSPDELSENAGNEIDFEILAQEIYGLLRQRLVIERERQGFYSGRLPW
jgi:hypothetical protein